MKKLLLLWLLVSVNVTAFGEPLVGSGTEGSPYIIASLDDFAEFCALPAYWGENVYAQLGANLDFAGQIYSSAPIGGDTSYQGKFDGGEHTISNLVVNGQYYVGLFGKVYGNAEIRNLKISDLTVNGTDYVGALAGRIDGGIVENCRIVDTGISGADYVGGLCGYSEAEISKCYLNVAVDGDDYTGGVCGEAISNISDCNVKCDLSGKYSVGGICGETSGKIWNCNIEGNVSGSKRVGGICGYVRAAAIVSDCFSYAAVVGSDERVGGIAGYSNQGVIERCGVWNSVVGANPSSVQNHTGGICGYNYGGDIMYSCSHADVDGERQVGGVCGYNASDGKISVCYSTGAVSGDYRVGGVCGYQYGTSGLIENCYSSGSVSGPLDGEVNGFCGGSRSDDVIVHCYWDIDTDAISNLNISNFGAVGKKTSWMKLTITYTGWDFVGARLDGDDENWRLCVEGSDYPMLWWEGPRNGDFVCNNGNDIYDLEFLAENWLNMAGDSDWDETADAELNDRVNLNDLIRFAETGMTAIDVK